MNREEGKRDDALEVESHNLESPQAIYEQDKVHLDDVKSLCYPTFVYEDRQDYGEAADLYEQCLEFEVGGFQHRVFVVEVAEYLSSFIETGNKIRRSQTRRDEY